MSVDFSLMQYWLATNRLDDGVEHHGTNDGDDEAPHIEATHATCSEEVEDPTTDDGSHDTNDDIEEYPLLCISLHDKRCDPSDETTENDIDKKTHMIGY